MRIILYLSVSYLWDQFFSQRCSLWLIVDDFDEFEFGVHARFQVGVGGVCVHALLDDLGDIL